MNKENQIEEMVKFVCMDCRYFMRCNDDTMCDGRTLGETLKEDCWTRKYAQVLYNAGYRKQSEGEWLPCIEDVEIYNSGGFTEKRQTGWICGNCKKGFSPCRKNFCPNCGAKMKGGQ